MNQSNVLINHPVKIEKMPVEFEDLDPYDTNIVSSVKIEKVEDPVDLALNSNDSDSGRKTPDAVEMKPYKCKRCGTLFPSLKVKLSHMHRVHRVKEKVECQVCKKVISSRNTFLKHVKVHTGESKVVVNCSICNKSVGVRSMKRHMMVHKGERPHVCEICSKSFCMLHEMKLHRLRHSKPKKTFSCTECNETFELLSDVNQHKKIHHSGKGNAQCKICLKMCDSEQDLLVHHSVHHTCRCEVCGHVFLTKADLISHQLAHADGKLYKCDFCPRTFQTETHLKEHIVTAKHSDQKAFVCKVCGQSYRKILFLNKHYKSAHNI